MTERKYALTKVGTGDYLLPSNDARTVWRIAKYEDGPSHGLEDMPRDRTFWGLWKWERPTSVGTYVDTEDWERWQMWGGHFDTRAEAIAAALKEPEGGLVNIFRDAGTLG